MAIGRHVARARQKHADRAAAKAIGAAAKRVSLVEFVNDDPRETSAVPRTVSGVPPAPQAPRESTDASEDLYQPLTDELRRSTVHSVEALLDDIKAIQTETRDEDGRIRRAKFVGNVLALRAEGFTPQKTAEIMGVSPLAVTSALALVRKDATIKDQVDRLTSLAVPLAMDNVIRGVMNGDKDYTLEVLKGAGAFRTHKSVQSEVHQKIEQLSIVTLIPAHLNGQPLPLPRAGAVVGAPSIASGMPSVADIEGVVMRSEDLPQIAPAVARDEMDV